MGYSNEVVNAITEFRPADQKSVFARTDLGSVTTVTGDELQLVHGPFNYRTRFIGDPNQPLLYKWTTQPVVALIGREGGVYPLAYAADIKRLPESLVAQVAEKLATAK